MNLTAVHGGAIRRNAERGTRLKIATGCVYKDNRTYQLYRRRTRTVHRDHESVTFLHRGRAGDRHLGKLLGGGGVEGGGSRDEREQGAARRAGRHTMEGAGGSAQVRGVTWLLALGSWLLALGSWLWLLALGS